MQRLEQWTRTRLAYLSSQLRGLAANLRLDGIEFADARQCLARYGRVGGDVDVVELPAHMRPASCFLNRVIRIALVIQSVESRIAVSLQNAHKIAQVPTRMLSFAIRRIGKPHRRW